MTSPPTPHSPTATFASCCTASPSTTRSPPCLSSCLLSSGSHGRREVLSSPSTKVVSCTRRRWLSAASTPAPVCQCPRDPSLLTDLVAFHSALDLRYFERARTWCAALLAFFGLLRIGEYCDGALLIGDVSAQPYGLDIVIRRSKTNPHADRISWPCAPTSSALQPHSATTPRSSPCSASPAVPVTRSSPCAPAEAVEWSSCDLRTSPTTSAHCSAACSPAEQPASTPDIPSTEAAPLPCCRPASLKPSSSVTVAGARTRSRSTWTPCPLPPPASSRRRRSFTRPSSSLGFTDRLIGQGWCRTTSQPVRCVAGGVWL